MEFLFMVMKHRVVCGLLTAGLAATACSPAALAQKKATGPATEQKAESKGMEPGGFYGAQPAVEQLDLAMYQRIRNEGLQHGKVMQLAEALMDGIGPRLTGSPNMAKANAWTRDTMTTIGLSNAHLEDWGEFGMGWQQINTWAAMVSPDPEPLWMQALPWSMATNGPVTGQVVYIPASKMSAVESMKDSLKGKIVLLGDMRDTPDLVDPLFHRYTEDELKKMTEYQDGSEQAARLRTALGGKTMEQYMAERMKASEEKKKAVKALADAGVLAVITPTRDGGKGGGTGIIFDDNGNMLARDGYKVEGKVPVPSAVMMIEHYNRLARMVSKGVPVTVTVDIETKFTGDHEHGFDTVAEIPGTDPKLKDQVVMVGGHLDSWISGTGATDNGAGSVIAMEALRILKALNVQPKRTIRVALWSGEEEGLFGSTGYVKQHFGDFAALPDDGKNPMPSFMRNSRGPLTITKEWEKLDAYYNVDNGTGMLRGIYTQGNFAIAPIFAQWIAPLHDLGVTTVTTRNTGGTDHLAFDAVGLPGFQFIQDPMDYETRTHHSDMDTVERLHKDDLEQAAIVEAIFLWNTSQREAMMPRKPFPHPEDEKQLGSPLKGIYPNAVTEAPAK